jgi:hypothetical protein
LKFVAGFVWSAFCALKDGTLLYDVYIYNLLFGCREIDGKPRNMTKTLINFVPKYIISLFFEKKNNNIYATHFFSLAVAASTFST